ncbi:hypothetical protein DFJ73DRAFT_825854 [Zopfochytrium polystomum]|nr:hypothetical protein DFJ73DRAFT_825854 [Zopfochytrium polystomum]
MSAEDASADELPAAVAIEEVPAAPVGSNANARTIVSQARPEHARSSSAWVSQRAAGSLIFELAHSSSNPGTPQTHQFAPYDRPGSSPIDLKAFMEAASSALSRLDALPSHSSHGTLQTRRSARLASSHKRAPGAASGQSPPRKRQRTGNVSYQRDDPSERPSAAGPPPTSSTGKFANDPMAEDLRLQCGLSAVPSISSHPSLDLDEELSNLHALRSRWSRRVESQHAERELGPLETLLEGSDVRCVKPSAIRTVPRHRDVKNRWDRTLDGHCNGVIDEAFHHYDTRTTITLHIAEPASVQNTIVSQYLPTLMADIAVFASTRLSALRDVIDCPASAVHLFGPAAAPTTRNAASTSSSAVKSVDTKCFGLSMFVINGVAWCDGRTGATRMALRALRRSNPSAVPWSSSNRTTPKTTRMLYENFIDTWLKLYAPPSPSTTPMIPSTSPMFSLPPWMLSTPRASSTPLPSRNTAKWLEDRKRAPSDGLQVKFFGDGTLGMPDAAWTDIQATLHADAWFIHEVGFGTSENEGAGATNRRAGSCVEGGICEHLMWVRDIRFTRKPAAKRVGNLPLTPRLRMESSLLHRKCHMCEAAIAEMYTIDHPLARVNPCWWCRGCFDLMNGGERVMDRGVLVWVDQKKGQTVGKNRRK